MTRPEWVEVAWQAWLSAGPTARDGVVASVAAVEPLIRADERAKAATHSTGTDTGGPCCQCCYEVHDLHNELAGITDYFEARQVERENLGGI